MYIRTYYIYNKYNIYIYTTYISFHIAGSIANLTYHIAGSLYIHYVYPLVILHSYRKYMKIPHLLLIYLFKMVIFYSYVSLPEGNTPLAVGIASHFPLYGWVPHGF